MYPASAILVVAIDMCDIVRSPILAYERRSVNNQNLKKL